MAGRVFISHSSDDAETAVAICVALESRGIACWIAPRDILPGADWAEQLIDGITQAQAMLLVFSSRSNASPQVRRELERAVHRRIALLPVRIEDVPPCKSFEYFLSSQHWLDAHSGAISNHFDAIASALEGVALRHDRVEPALAAGPPVIDEACSRLPLGQPAAMVTPPAWPPETLARIEAALAEYVGPVATTLVKRAAARCTDQGALVSALASEVDKASDRQAFVDACRSKRAPPR
ncbi:MAG: toll/interleukin-1 receptor domain-containing protein [Rhizobacter sp.]|nr:toll/interleukin-1 receptor domain-containing protein [Rhizobacter sp.]